MNCRTFPRTPHSEENVTVSHTTFSLLEIPILSHKPLRMRVQPNHQRLNKTLLFCDCESNFRCENKDCMKAVTFIRSFPVIHAGHFVPTLFYFSPVACTPRKVSRHMISNFDVCKVDVDMQMSFLNAALYWEPPRPSELLC